MIKSKEWISLPSYNIWIHFSSLSLCCILKFFKFSVTNFYDTYGYYYCTREIEKKWCYRSKWKNWNLSAKINLHGYKYECDKFKLKFSSSHCHFRQIHHSAFTILFWLCVFFQYSYFCMFTVRQRVRELINLRCLHNTHSKWGTSLWAHVGGFDCWMSMLFHYV